MRKQLVISLMALAGLNLVSVAAQAQQYATALLDITGSMQVTRTDGKTRCEYGKQLFLETVAIAMDRSDYLNIKTFGSPGELVSLTGGFIYVNGMSPVTGSGKVFFDDIARQVNAMSCNRPSTALGDAICDSTDEIRSYVSPSTSQEPKLAVVTDAGENSSRYCGGTSYVDTHIIPRLFAPAPRVNMNLSILVPPGNVGRSYRQSLSQSLESVPVSIAASRMAPSGYSSEVEALVRAAKASGGGAIVITDSVNCTANCDPMSQDPSGDDDDWGGAW